MDGGQPAQGDTALLQVRRRAFEKCISLVHFDAVQLNAMAAGDAWRKQCMQQRPVSTCTNCRPIFTPALLL